SSAPRTSMVSPGRQVTTGTGTSTISAASTTKRIEETMATTLRDIEPPFNRRHPTVAKRTNHGGSAIGQVFDRCCSMVPTAEERDPPCQAATRPDQRPGASEDSTSRNSA